MLFSNTNRTIFIGDVHGCYTELRDLLHLLQHKKSDTLVFLGDLINKGPNSAEVLRFVHSLSPLLVLGNHDFDYLAKSNIDHNHKKLRSDIGEKIHSWFSHRPFYIKTEKFIAVHAGLHPTLPPSQTPKEFLFNVRTCSKDGKTFRDLSHTPWYELYEGAKPIFYGHWASNGLKIINNTHGIDTGCVYGGMLTAYVLESKELVQVKAKEVYSPIKMKGTK